VGKRIYLAGLAALLAALLLLPGLSRAMQSTSYAINWDVIGAGGGPASSSSFALNATLGQGVVGPAASGSFQVGAGYWVLGGQYSLFLPVVLRDYSTVAFAEPCSTANNYCEDYDGWQTAYGPLAFDTAYQAYPDDGTDYYYFELDADRSVTVALQNYQATGDLILYQHREGDEPDWVASWGQGGSSMTLGPLSLTAAKYYVRVYTTGGENSTALYSLTVTTD